MKTREFIEWMDKFGYELKIKDSYYYILESSFPNLFVATVSRVDVGLIDTKTNAMKVMDEDKKVQFLNILIKYSITPIERRKESKYYFKIKLHRGEDIYVNYHKGHYHFGVKEEREGYQTKFTNSEYDKFPTTLKSLFSYGHLFKEGASEDLDTVSESRANFTSNNQKLEERIEELELEVDDLESQLHESEELVGDLENQVYDLEKELGMN